MEPLRPPSRNPRIQNSYRTLEETESAELEFEAVQILAEALDVRVLLGIPHQGLTAIIWVPQDFGHEFEDLLPGLTGPHIKHMS